MIFFLDKVTIRTKIYVLFVWNFAPVVYVVVTAGGGGLAATGTVFNTWDIIQCLHHDKSNSISQFNQWQFKRYSNEK